MSPQIYKASFWANKCPSLYLTVLVDITKIKETVLKKSTMSELLKLSGTTSASFKASNANSLLNVCDVPAILRSIPGYDELENDYCLGVEFNLESLKAAVDLRNSLDKAPFPNIKASDETPVRLSKFAEIISGYPKIGVEIVKGDDKIGGFDLQNRGIILDIEMRYPFLGTGYVKLLGATDRLKVRLYDYGDGLINGDKDYIAIEGDYTLKISGVEKKKGEILQKLNYLDLNSIGGRVDFTSGTLDIQPMSLKMAVEIIGQFPWIHELDISGAPILSLEGLEQLTDIRRLDAGSSKIKDFDSIKKLEKLEILVFSSVNCSELDIASIIRKNLNLYNLRLNNSKLSSSSVDSVLLEYQATRTKREERVWADMFVIDLRNNQPPSTDGIDAANGLRANGWTVYHD